MTLRKTLCEREKELQSLLATPEGREKLQELVTQYQMAGARLRPTGKSIVTYLLVHEREQGLIVD